MGGGWQALATVLQYFWRRLLLSILLNFLHIHGNFMVATWFVLAMAASKMPNHANHKLHATEQELEILKGSNTR